MAIARSDRDVDEYLASLDEPIQTDMKRIDALFRSVMGENDRCIFEGTFWGGSEQVIVGYGIVTYQNRSKKKVEWSIVSMALQKNYISVYLGGVVDGMYVAEKYGHELGAVKVGKSNIRFKKLADIDMKKLEKLATLSKDNMPANVSRAE